MAKDSQMDNKLARKRKANGQTPPTRENRNRNPSRKKRYVKNNDA